MPGGTLKIGKCPTPRIRTLENGRLMPYMELTDTLRTQALNLGSNIVLKLHSSKRYLKANQFNRRSVFPPFFSSDPIKASLKPTNAWE